MINFATRIFLTVLVLFAVAAGCNKKEPAASKQPQAKSASTKMKVVTAGFDSYRDSLYRRQLKSDTSSTSQKMFSIVTDSGIDFTNTFSREKPDRLADTGAGVAIADYDSDGEVDIYLLAAEGPNKLFRGLGDFKFEDVTDAAGVDGSIGKKDTISTGASFADVDNDGDLDLLVCNMNDLDILYINRGDGTFKDEAYKRGLQNEGPSKIGSFCDYDLDGDLDIYLVTYRGREDRRQPRTVDVYGHTYIHPDYRDAFGFVDEKIVEAGQRDFLYRNDGNGFFSNVTADAKLVDHAMGLSASWLDYNDDGLPDIYVANDFWQSDHLFKNQGDGTFVDALPDVTLHSPWFATGSDSGDLNNDGLVDVIVGDVVPATHFRQKLNVSIQDNHAWFMEYGSPRQYSRNAVYANSGSDSFMEVGFMTGLSHTNWTWATRLADLNNDGQLDVFITNGHARDTMNWDIHTELRRLKDNDELTATKASKLVPILPDKNLAFMNVGNFQFENVSQEWGLDLEGISHGVAFSDIDHDGDLDMVVNNFYQKATAYRNESNKGNRLTISLRSGYGNSFGYGSKIELWSGTTRQVKHLTPVRGYVSSDEPIVHFGLGEASTVDRMRITWPGGNVQEFENLESGYSYLAIEANPESKTQQSPVEPKAAFAEVESGLAIEFSHSDGKTDDFARQPLLPYRPSQMGPGLAFGDINSDGLPDVYLCNGNNKPGSLFVNRGGTFFEEVQGPWNKHFLQDDQGALFFDADGDGDQDLLVTSGGTNFKQGHEKLHDRLYLNQQGEAFIHAENAFEHSAFNSSTAAALDFDHDGDLDLVIGSRSVPRKYPQSSPSRLLRNDKGKFVDVGPDVAKPLSEIGIVNSILCSDFDNDGWTDMVVATEWGPVRFLKNNNGKFLDVTDGYGVASQTGWWRGLAAGDFDSDGDLDFVATNLGTNTRYHADPAHPWRLYFGDFNGNGRMNLIESMYEGDTEYPVRGFKSISSAMPFVGEKFDTHEAFASASLANIYDLENLPHELKEATWLQSAIFWNDGDSMRIEALPRMAQTSPGFGVEALDHDCDGDVDILIANNFFGTDPKTGYMDGGHGVLLSNDGTGKFDFVWPNRSGVKLRDDSKGLAIDDLDFDGDLDAVVGVHSRKARTLINQANPTAWWKLSIAGPDGNPTSVGARAMVVRKNGSNQMHEIRAGGSYLSQSVGAIFLYASEQNPITSITVRWPTGEVAEINSSEFEEHGELSIDIGDYPKALGQ